MNSRRYHPFSRSTRRADILILASLALMALAIAMVLRNRALELLTLVAAGSISGVILVLGDHLFKRHLNTSSNASSSAEEEAIDLRSTEHDLREIGNDQSRHAGRVTVTSTNLQVGVSEGDLSRIALSDDIETRLAAARSSGNQALLEKLADDESAEVRAAVAERIEDLSVLQKLARDADSLVQAQARTRLGSA